MGSGPIAVPVLLAAVLSKELRDPAIDNVLSPVEALRVPAEEHLDAVARALRNLGGVHAGVEPGRQRRVPQVVRSRRQRRRRLFGRERQVTRSSQTRQYVVEATTPPRSLANSRPSLAVPNSPCTHGASAPGEAGTGRRLSRSLVGSSSRGRRERRRYRSSAYRQRAVLTAQRHRFSRTQAAEVHTGEQRDEL